MIDACKNKKILTNDLIKTRLEIDFNNFEFIFKY